MKFDIDIN